MQHKPTGLYKWIKTDFTVRREFNLSIISINLSLQRVICSNCPHKEHTGFDYETTNRPQCRSGGRIQDAVKTGVTKESD
jgi:hypothetical protein